jgi:flagellar assembly factor FliW
MAAAMEDKAFEFTPGILGFPHVKRYVVADIPNAGDVIKQLIAVDEPDLGFTLVDPFAFFPDYAPDIPDADVRELGAERPDQIVVMAIANIPAQFKEATANLKAPLIFNPFTRKARQVVLADERYTTRHRLFKAE